ncbi:MAG: hypothetical protein ACXWYM_00390 [Candidatus Binatia bacterium]
MIENGILCLPNNTFVERKSDGSAVIFETATGFANSPRRTNEINLNTVQAHALGNFLKPESPTARLVKASAAAPAAEVKKDQEDGGLIGKMKAAVKKSSAAKKKK